MSVLRVLAPLILMLSVSGMLPSPDVDGFAGGSHRDKRTGLAHLRLRMRPTANGALTASGVDDPGVAARTWRPAQPGESGPTTAAPVLSAAGSPLSLSIDSLLPAPAARRPLRGPPPAPSFR